MLGGVMGIKGKEVEGVRIVLDIPYREAP